MSGQQPDDEAAAGAGGAESAGEGREARPEGERPQKPQPRPGPGQEIPLGLPESEEAFERRKRAAERPDVRPERKEPCDPPAQGDEAG